MQSYQSLFTTAIDRTVSWGLVSPDINILNKLLIDGHGMEKMANIIQSVMGEINVQDVSLQCFSINYLLKGALEQALDSPLFYTLGYVCFHQHNVFYTPEEELKAMIKTPPGPGSLRLHAWLTTPALEIIDPTFSTTYGLENDEPECIGCVMAKHYSQFTPEICHVPQIVGDDFLVKIGGVINMTLVY